MKIGILECGRPQAPVIDKWGDHPALFRHLLGEGFRYAQWAVFEDEFPASASDCDGWLITGSKFGVYEDHAWIPRLEAFIRECYAGRVPMYGVCFGHQIMAQALGGRVEKFAGGWALGPTEYQTTHGAVLVINAFHQDQVITPPPGATTTAFNAFCAHAALVYDGGHAASIQPHPEFSPAYLTDLTKSAKAVVPDALYASVVDVAPADDASLDRQAVAQTMRAFFRDAHTNRQAEHV